MINSHLLNDPVNDFLVVDEIRGLTDNIELTTLTLRQELDQTCVSPAPDGALA